MYFGPLPAIFHHLGLWESRQYGEVNRLQPFATIRRQLEPVPLQRAHHVAHIPYAGAELCGRAGGAGAVAVRRVRPAAHAWVCARRLRPGLGRGDAARVGRLRHVCFASPFGACCFYWWSVAALPFICKCFCEKHVRALLD